MHACAWAVHHYLFGPKKRLFQVGGEEQPVACRRASTRTTSSTSETYGPKSHHLIQESSLTVWSILLVSRHLDYIILTESLTVNQLITSIDQILMTNPNGQNATKPTSGSCIACLSVPFALGLRPRCDPHHEGDEGGCPPYSSSLSSQAPQNPDSLSGSLRIMTTPAIYRIVSSSKAGSVSDHHPSLPVFRKALGPVSMRQDLPDGE